MTLFTNYRKRILKRIAQLENEQADLVLESVKLDRIKEIIDELKSLL